jgi:hypothetical protein
MTELSKQMQRCHDCYLVITERGLRFEEINDCPVFSSYKRFGETECPIYIAITEDIRKAQSGDPTLGSGATIVQKLAEEGKITVSDMGIFDRYFK